MLWPGDRVCLAEQPEFKGTVIEMQSAYCTVRWDGGAVVTHLLYQMEHVARVKKPGPMKARGGREVRDRHYPGRILRAG